MAGGEGVVGDEGGELGGAHLQGLEAMVGTFSKYDGKPWRVCRGAEGLHTQGHFPVPTSQGT